MKLPRRKFLHVAAGAAALPSLSLGATAGDYPTRPVKIVVGFAAGGAVDIVARLIAQWLSDRIGQQCVVENRPGAGNNIAAEYVLKSDPDGYTLLLTNPTNAINATYYENLPYDFIRDSAPVAGIMRVPNVMEVSPLLPTTTVPEFVALAKANPGKLAYATGGNGTSVHMSAELFKLMTNTDILNVTYRGLAFAYTDLMTNRVQVTFVTCPARSDLSARASSALWPSPREHVRPRSLIFRRLPNSSPVMKRAPGTASARRETLREQLSASSTKRSMPAWPTRLCKRG